MWEHPITLWTETATSGFTPNWLKFTLLVFLLLIIVSMRICIYMAWRVMRRPQREAHYVSLLASVVTLYFGAVFVSQYFPKFNVPNLVRQAAELWTLLT